MYVWDGEFIDTVKRVKLPEDNDDWALGVSENHGCFPNHEGGADYHTESETLHHQLLPC